MHVFLMVVAMKESKANVPESIRDTAIDWWLRQNNRTLSKKEQADFEAWLAGDEANKAAFEKISKICGIFAARKPGTKPGRKRRGAWRKPVAAIAGVVALCVFYDDLSVFLRSDYSTGTAETKFVTLEDGSHVQLSAKSAIAVHYSSGQRRLSLLQGEAWFEVSPDSTRPFIVDAMGGTITALGTAFDVDVENAWAHVVVTQHRVAIASGGQNVIVEEGHQSAYAKGTAAQPPEPVNIERATAWLRGKLIFRNRPLGEVVEALGRYHHGYVYFVNSELRTRPVSGVFGVDDPLAALDEIETALGVHAVYLSSYLVILYE